MQLVRETEIDPGIDCVISVHRGLPRDRMGNRLSASGRWLIAQAVETVYGIGISACDMHRDEFQRWSVPGPGLHASVAHCAGHAVVALSADGPVGVDLQDERDRPLAMAWLGDLLGNPSGAPATIRDFAECEALIKASHIRKETFNGVRLPTWQPGWRLGNTGYQLLSTPVLSPVPVESGLHLALATRTPGPVRWHWDIQAARPEVRRAVAA
jgi:hypothetical protein